MYIQYLTKERTVNTLDGFKYDLLYSSKSISFFISRWNNLPDL